MANWECHNQAGYHLISLTLWWSSVAIHHWWFSHIFPVPLQRLTTESYFSCIHGYHIPGWWLSPTPLKHDGVKVSWDDDIPNWMESHKSHVPNHQPDYPPTPADARGSAPGNNTLDSLDSCFGLLPQRAQQHDSSTTAAAAAAATSSSTSSTRSSFRALVFSPRAVIFSNLFYC